MYSTFVDVPVKDISTGKWEKQKALLLGKSEWDRLRGHMQFLYKDAEIADKEYRLREEVKEMSKFMVKDWEDTFKNLREQRLVANKKRLKAIEERRLEVQRAFQKEQAAEKNKYLETAQKALYYNKDNVKMLNQSLRFSEVLKTREVQLEFDKKLKALRDKKEQAYAEKCKKDAEEYRKEKELEKMRRIEKMNKNKADLLAQMKENEKIKLEEEQEKEREREDLINLKKEIEMAEKCAEDEASLKKARFKKQIGDFLESERKYKETKKCEEEVEDKLIEIYARTKRRIEKMKKDKQKELQKKYICRKEKIKEYLATQLEEKATDEDARMEQAAAEKEIEAEKNRQRKLRYQQQLKEERIQANQDSLKREAKTKKEEQELKKWDMMQRFKENEANKKFYKEREERNIKNKKEIHNSYMQQIKEREEVIKEDREEEEAALKQTLRLYDADNEAFLNYADEIIEDSKKKGRYLRPILEAVEKHKRAHGLGNNQKVPALKTRFLFGPPPENEEPRHWGPCVPNKGPCATNFQQ